LHWPLRQDPFEGNFNMFYNYKLPIIAAMIATAAMGSALASDPPTSFSHTFTVGQNQQTFTLEYVDGSHAISGGKTSLQYDLSSDPANTSMSHFTFGVCAEVANKLESLTINGTPVKFEIGFDPTTGLFGFKSDEDVFPGRYTLTFDGAHDLGAWQVAFKQGNTFAAGTILGLRCSSEPPIQDPTFQVAGRKFYDLNGNGLYDAGDILLPGWAIKVTINDADTYVTTDANGVYLVGGLNDGDTYAISELMPNETGWFRTSPVETYTGTIDGANVDELDFGNLRFGMGNGRTIGFWGNNNGQARFMSTDNGASALFEMRALNLRNGSGAHFDPTTYTQFRTWLRGATAENMVYMLSAQLAAAKLNTLPQGFGDYDDLVWTGDGVVTIGSIIEAANAALADPLSFTREELEALKNLLDDYNNNLNFIAPTPGEYTFTLP
jgi:hypothetical protein